jgi:hypothetical protein
VLCAIFCDIIFFAPSRLVCFGESIFGRLLSESRKRDAHVAGRESAGGMKKNVLYERKNARRLSKHRDTKTANALLRLSSAKRKLQQPSGL